MNADAKHDARPTRRGSLLPEVLISAAVLAVILSLTVKVLGQVGHQRRAAERRQRALVEVANAMERITAFPYGEVTEAHARDLKVSPESTASLPDAELNVNLRDETAAPDRPSRRIAVRLRWKNPSGEWEAPVRLVTWIKPSRGRTTP
jgi:Tfp pilus assembly protein PilV